MTTAQQLELNTYFPWVKTDDPVFKNALDTILDTNDNMLIIGPGGVGKSILLKIAAKLLDGDTVVLSTTGVSAANLAGEGIVTSTVHSFFRLPPVTIVENPTMYPDLAPVMQNVDTILIDEVSMLNASVFDTIIKLLKKYRAFQEDRLPRIIMFGDVLQLPPVVEDKDPAVQQLFERRYNGKHMFFNADEYKLLDCKVVHLNHIYRQNDDNWKSILNRIRIGQHTQHDLNVINSRVVSSEQQYVKEHPNMMCLAATNKKVQALNDFYLDTNNSRIYRATIDGTYELKGTNHQMYVEIAPGMQVMCTHNAKDKTYQNGTLGHVTSMTPHHVYIKTKDGSNLSVGYEKWEQYKYKYDQKEDKVTHEVTGSFTQIGCVPAFATTIHKAQGLTLDNLMLDPEGLKWMSPSLAYVALSRCTSLDGIGLLKPLKMTDIKTNMESVEFLEENT